MTNYKASFETFIENGPGGSRFCLTVYTGGETMIISYRDKDPDKVSGVLRVLESRLVAFLSRKADEFKTSDIPGLNYNLLNKKDGAK